MGLKFLRLASIAILLILPCISGQLISRTTVEEEVIDESNTSTEEPTTKRTIITTTSTSAESTVSETTTKENGITEKTETTNNTSESSKIWERSSSDATTQVHVPFHYFDYPHQVHSCLQMIGWCMFALIGFFLEVHFPIMFTTRRGRQVKLALLLQLSSMIFALSGIIVLIAMVGFGDNWSSHKILGLTAMTLRMTAAVIMCFRPRNGDPPKRFHVIGAYARIVLTRLSILLGIATVFTGFTALFGELELPAWIIVLLSLLIVSDVICEAIMFYNAYRSQNDVAEETQQLISSKYYTDNYEEMYDDDETPHRKLRPDTIPLTKIPLRLGVTILFSVIALSFSTAIIAGGVYYDPTWQY